MVDFQADSNLPKAMIKSLTHKLISKAGGVSAAANYCDTTAATMSNATNPNTPYTISVLSLVSLTCVTGDSSLLDYIIYYIKNNSCGNLNNPQKATFNSIMQKLAEIQKEHGEFSVTSLHSLSDGDASTTDVAIMKKELIDSINAQQEMLELLNAGVGNDQTEELPK